MIEFLYGSKDFASRVGTEIDEHRPVSLRIVGWRKGFIQNFLALYAEYAKQLLRQGNVRKGVLFGLAWRSIIAPSFIALCNQASSSGMSITSFEKGPVLEVRFEIKGEN